MRNNLLPLIAALGLVACGQGEPDAEAVTAPTVDTTAAATPVTQPPAAAAPTPVDPAASQIDFAALAGTWTVVGVAPGDGVQAMGMDDPAYMGRTVAIDGDRLAWTDPRATGGGTFIDRCTGPVTQRLAGPATKAADDHFAGRLKALGVRAADPHAVECETGNWGPEAAGGATLYASGADTLAFSWYDGVVLKLVRTKG